MYIDFDDETRKDLKELSDALGRSQEELVKEAVREYLEEFKEE